ncbi:hypothetical protein [Sphingobacterium sp. 2149]|uniref:hypothetical protein n=1 Tax=Sphingobacterium sp. 2149 TaxID=2817763 RepID=UPI00285C43DC|nr:hypothetical protein [Sphingobacterium sp. 2149]MDR6734180.1 2'-5' RNA ligase [Sphingobacterium sp. 2149]
MANIKYGSLMYFPFLDKIKWRKAISQLFDPSLEIDFNFRPHITILYGFDNSKLNIEKLHNNTNKFLEKNPLNLNAKQITTFHNTPQVLKIDIIDLNGNLFKLNEIIRNEF